MIVKSRDGWSSRSGDAARKWFKRNTELRDLGVVEREGGAMK
jgi:hypothetical protein